MYVTNLALLAVRVYKVNIYQSNRAVEQTCSAVLSGDHIRKATPVPIPNTAVKLSEPMIVYTNAKVGIAGLFKTPLIVKSKGFFY
jgi:hypothetical protein